MAKDCVLKENKTSHIKKNFATGVHGGLRIQWARRLCQISQSQLLILRTVNITARPQMDCACAR